MKTSNGPSDSKPKKPYKCLNVDISVFERALITAAFRKKRIGKYSTQALLNAVLLDEAAMRQEMNAPALTTKPYGSFRNPSKAP